MRAVPLLQKLSCYQLSCWQPRSQGSFSLSLDEKGARVGSVYFTNQITKLNGAVNMNIAKFPIGSMLSC